MNTIFRLIFLFSFFTINAQIHEIGLVVGGSNYVGDIGKTTYINPSKPAFGIVYKWNRSPRFAYRASFMNMQIEGDDLKSKELSRKNRRYYFSNNLKELSLGFEFNFHDFDLHDMQLG